MCPRAALRRCCRNTRRLREIVFVDPGISDLDTLLRGVRPGIETHLLTTDEPALAQMARAVAGRSGLEAIHVISHGKPGEVSFSARRYRGRRH